MSTAKLGIGIVASVAFLAITACSQKPESAPQASAPPPVEAPPPAPPPPSPAKLYSNGLDLLGAAETNRGRIVTFSSAGFAPDRKSLEPADAQQLDKIAILLRDNPQVRVWIEGFTSNRGTVKAAEKVSRARAESLQKALVQDRSIDANRLHVRGRGKQAPVADNATAEGRERNARIELIFSGVDGTFATAEDTSWDEK